MPQGDQVRNGKAFEYALALQYYLYLTSVGKNVELVESDALDVARNFYDALDERKEREFDFAASQTIGTILKIEPGLISQRTPEDRLFIELQSDASGIDGDVRDVVFRRKNPSWEIGFSAKNNNDAVKHSRLGRALDFGKEWVGCPCSQTYWREVRPVFDFLLKKKAEGQTFESLGEDKYTLVYVPLLRAFRDEMLRLCAENDGVPEKLVQYLIGNRAFYKVIKDDSHKMVVVKAFNVMGELNRTVGGVPAQYVTPRINLPSRIVEFDFMPGREQTTLDMILDGGWEISFRIHCAEKKIVPSLKFDIRLLGNPPILFTQHLFR